jgi:hypothetical protein
MAVCLPVAAENVTRRSRREVSRPELAISSMPSTVRRSGVMMAPRHIELAFGPLVQVATGLLSASRLEPAARVSRRRTVLSHTNATCCPSAVQDSASTFTPP